MVHPYSDGSLPITGFPNGTRTANTTCPVWIMSRHYVTSTPCPLFPSKRTFISAVCTSALCQKQTLAASWLRSARLRCRAFHPIPAQYNYWAARIIRTGSPRPPGPSITEAEVTCPLSVLDVPCVANAPFQDLPHLWCDLGELCEFRVVARIVGFNVC